MAALPPTEDKLLLCTYLIFLNQPGCSIRVVPLNENIPVLAPENVTSFIFTYSSCTNLSAQHVAKI